LIYYKDNYILAEEIKSLDWPPLRLFERYKHIIFCNSLALS